jgi:thioredoxin-dependent peroxiredoxin
MNIRSSICSVIALLILSLTSVGQAADAPALGSIAPGFKLQDQNSQWHTLEEYRGKWVALYFYPKDETPGCTTEACEFRDNVFAFRDANAVIVGISVDDTASHKKFSEKHGLPFTLLADPSKATAQTYGVMRGLTGAVGVAQRDTFLIDPTGKIVKHYVRVDPKGHSTAVLADIKALQAKQSK